MRISLYEHITATSHETDPLYREGKAMRDALHDDLLRISDLEVINGEFDRSLREADACILIAPESEGILERLSRRVLDFGGKLFGPHPDAIRLTTDKLSLSRHWQQRGVPTPSTSLAVTGHYDFPAVLKPRDGAGSESTYLVENVAEYMDRLSRCSREMIVQPLVAGEPASIAFLVGPHQTLPLCPARQRLSSDGLFQYVGGELPLPPQEAERAIHLGRAAIEAVPSGLFGYVGVDLILGEAEDGSEDFAIEINPRLTTSYVGLRAATSDNIAEAMLRICAGFPVAELKWLPVTTEWGSDFRAIRKV
jgi:predicted ATP-grasp superfamily ATP-dependent carboligase